MELNYFSKQMQGHSEAARKAAAVLLGGIEAIRSMAWIDNDYSTCARANRIIENALKEAGQEWHFYQKAQQECAEYAHKLKSIHLINGN